MRKKITICVALLLVFVIAGAGGVYYYQSQKKGYHFNHSEKEQQSAKKDKPDKKEGPYAVSTSSDLATQVGMEILESGGNAVDAAVGIAYTLGVVEPYGSGIGGGGSLVIHDSNTGKSYTYDYLSAAGSTRGETAVPGFVAGMEEVWNDYGTIDMEKLLEPAIYYAENGFEVNKALALRLNGAREEMKGYAQFKDEDGNYLEEGSIMSQLALAKTLKNISENGKDAFYSGDLAENIADETCLSKEDFRNYRVYKRGVVKGKYQGYKIYSADAPMSGATLIQALKMSELSKMKSPEENLSRYIDQLTTIIRTAKADRFEHLCDPAQHEYDGDRYTDTDYIRNLMKMDITDFEEEDESMETTSFSVVDSDGLSVVCVNTLSSFFGGKKSVDGVILNNTGANLNGSGINGYAPGRRARTNISPTIITDDDGYVMAIGTPGGNIIPCIMFEVITSIFRDGRDYQEAVDDGRIIYWKGNLIMEGKTNINKRLDTSTLNQSVIWRDSSYWFGSVSIAGIEGGKAFAAYDSRRGATMCGVHND